MDMPFFRHHLYWIGAYGLDNLETLLPAGSSGGSEGKYYPLFATKVAEALRNDAGLWESARP